jgi:hypothetical protein
MILPSLADTTTTARHVGGPVTFPSPSVGEIARVTVNVSLFWRYSTVSGYAKADEMA